MRSEICSLGFFGTYKYVVVLSPIVSVFFNYIFRNLTFACYREIFLCKQFITHV